MSSGVSSPLAICITISAGTRSARSARLLCVVSGNGRSRVGVSMLEPGQVLLDGEADEFGDGSVVPFGHDLQGVQRFLADEEVVALAHQNVVGCATARTSAR